ncbi:MAG: hypothetical protein AB199_02790 [Parcubacteria bacterium C7867-004]|nr:MAG: hypothetical protein AB199_02790 [Parcubacteria bacterium C7867-004]
MSGETIYDSRNEAQPTHYHGDLVRGLFVAAAVLVFLTQFIGARLPYSSGGLILIILVLVIAAGITNPVQRWIHWANAAISVIGVLMFGGLALARFDSNPAFLSQNVIVPIIAVIFIGTLYFSTATVRGFLVPHVDPNDEPEDPRLYIADPE